jgi:hypothetical protein
VVDIEEVRIAMPPQDLADFRDYLLTHGSNLDPEEIHEISPGFNREPIIIALVVALGGPVVTRQFAGLIKRWLELRSAERLARIQVLARLAGGGKRELTVAEINELAKTM